ncbi:hypothetical protein M407DRAFT_19689 [Tulasnella calospora MUT 4182]|uniref:Uncharacterized protein n=1 Tax=Tulasnella calospora MUT 4182 TaxID=1051891 RepID=A0A0C3MC45_9AGAM|nr:hypothetical protein M407DRAFT_19689 [Tulasnella calospora MUT 4182]
MTIILDTIGVGRASREVEFVKELDDPWTQLDPSKDPSIGNYWENAKKKKEVLHPLSSAAGASTVVPSQNTQIPVWVGVNYLDKPGNPPGLGTSHKRELVFPAIFARFSFANLVAYGLAHPMKPAVQTTTPHNPIKVQVMDTLYLRSLTQPARWKPIVLHNELTLQGYLDSKSQPEVRFISSKVRFILVSSKTLERTYNLDSGSERREMTKSLDQAWLGSDPPLGTPSSSESSASSSDGTQSFPGSRPNWEYPPRTCIVVVGRRAFDTLCP